MLGFEHYGHILPDGIHLSKALYIPVCIYVYSRIQLIYLMHFAMLSKSSMSTGLISQTYVPSTYASTTTHVIFQVSCMLIWLKQTKRILHGHYERSRTSRARSKHDSLCAATKSYLWSSRCSCLPVRTRRFAASFRTDVTRSRRRLSGSPWQRCASSPLFPIVMMRLYAALIGNGRHTYL